jgi:hypothetical protein
MERTRRTLTAKELIEFLSINPEAEVLIAPSYDNIDEPVETCEFIDHDKSSPVVAIDWDQKIFHIGFKS